PLPIQLGSDYKTARTYLIAETIRWVQSDRLTALFKAAQLSSSDAQSVREVLPTALNIESLAVWLCEEFGHLRAIRHATHARRYLATRMTTGIQGGARPAKSSGRPSGDAFQQTFDRWSNPLCEIEDSLHFQRVIAPLTARLVRIGEANNAIDDSPVAANSNEA
ncbi:MAG: hypothetical protein WA989_14275, partial [Henriciella sp.]|uniref:hypothetical protein n=1 Tax=Henriciella sp. TaxID=1968823 RepID=UPI003C729E7C